MNIKRSKYFQAVSIYAIMLMAACLSLYCPKARAQDAGVTKTYSSRLAGSNLIAGNSIDLPYSADNEQAVVINNIITLGIVEENASFVPENYTATVTVKIEYGSSPTSLASTPLQQDLTVTYNKGGGVKYNPKNYLSFKGAKYVKVTVLSVNAPVLSNGLDTKTLLLLENEMRVKRFYELNGGINLQPVFGSDPLPNSPVPDELPISWQWPNDARNNQSQLEWTWVENELLQNYKNTDNSINYDKIFRNNATRVDLPLNITSYRIPLFYDGAGVLYYRVRATTQKPGGSRSDGPWSAIQSFPFPGHNNSLNWQVVTSFAEDGKRKSVMQYYDGSLRMRQTVTKDNSTNTTLTAETFYDGQGRPAVQVLPAPGINTIVGYTQNLNLFNGQANNEDPASYFDLQPVSTGGSLTPLLSTASGSSLYYSGANPEHGSDANPHLPDAAGYPYSVTRYTPDATGRIMSQSGVGEAMRMSSTHEIKYYYGNAALEELDGLFGTEAGNYSHYFKNMVKDANGQMSVSYVDMHGRTIATALAGDAPNGMVALDLNATQYPGQAGTRLTRNLLDKGTNVAKGNSIESLTSILVPATTAYQFLYKLDPQSLQMPQCNSDQQVCYSCMYDLEIAVTDESGDIAPIVRKFSNVSLTGGGDCSSGVPSFNGGNTIQFTETLLPGSYSIRKTLTISESSLQRFKDQYLQVGLCKTEQQVIDSIYNVLLSTSDCNSPSTTPSCQACRTELGSYDDFKADYLANFTGNFPPESEIQAAFATAQARCDALCLNSTDRLAMLRAEMLSDMTPFSGQYAKDPGSVTGTHTSMYDKYDIFAMATPATQPFYKYPVIVSGELNLPYYYDASGAIDPTIHPDLTNDDYLHSISPSAFANLFIPSWANSLLRYHPEYEQLIFAEDHLKEAYSWIDKFNQITTFNDAVAGNFVSPVGSAAVWDPFFNLEPNDKREAMKKIETDSYYNGLSLWQIAYGGATRCKTITDLTARDDCYRAAPKQPPFTGLTVDQQNEVWNIFKGLYSSVRDSMVMRFIKVNKPLADGDELVNQKYILRFPTSISQVATQYNWTGFPTTPGEAPNVSFSDSIAAAGVSRCSSNIDRWRTALSDCPALAAKPNKDDILNEITAGMVAVCVKGQDERNPYGASTVAPSTPQNVTPRSFEAVIETVFRKYNIDASQYCNPFVIEFPKPYGQGPVFTKSIMVGVDKCACDQFAKIKQDAIAANVDVADLNKLNQYLNSTYQETLTPVLFEALQRCSVLGTVSCRTIYHISTGPCTPVLTDPCSYPPVHHLTVDINSLGAITPAASIDTSNPGTPVDTCTLVYTTLQCDTISFYMLSEPQFKPAFLQCGFTASSHCVSCAMLSQLTADYKAYFKDQPCAEAPIFATDNLTPEQISYNITFQQFVNYRTGLQFNWMEYSTAAKANGCDLSHYSTNGSATQNVVCRENRPLNDSTGVFVKEPPCQKVYNMAAALGTLIYQQRKEQLLADFEAAYRNRCMAAKDNEQFSVQYDVKEYHYTLYYYDMAGNLVKTVPPKGARPDFSSGFILSVENAKRDGNQVVPAHIFTTNYRYNSLNAVAAQLTPDAGKSSFWYDALGRLVVSQNAQQNIDVKYSYTLYDALGRITEVGQKPQGEVMNQWLSRKPADLDYWINGSGGTKEQVTATVYDVSLKELGFNLGSLLTQQNLRNRVSFTFTKGTTSDANWYTASAYTYDIHGNVDTLLQDYSGVSAMAAPNRYKRICYDYDLISGKVNGVDYQSGAYDAFYHRYRYDAENRLVDVYTSRDSIVWERDATYSYYKHGPLARTVLGQLQTQGLDYSYTLQGWLKGVNTGIGVDNSGSSCPSGSALDEAVISRRPLTDGPALYVARSNVDLVAGFGSEDGDIFDVVVDNSLPVCTLPGSGSGSGGGSGSSGGAGSAGITEAYPVGQDAYSFSLHYYPQDYVPIGSAVPVTGVLESLPTQGAPLYNGNIASMAVNIPTLGDARVYNYHYDQLNRLSQMDAFSGLNTNTNSFTPVQLDDYKERVSYDPNGNILKYLRNGKTAGSRSLAMDDLTYNYYPSTNKLSRLNDAAPSSNYTEDIDDQGSGDNYNYDAIGNLKSDAAEGITDIQWSVYGKILGIQRTATGTNPNSDIKYTYDASGNRITKTVNNSTTTVYVRDAQGNVMSLYQLPGSGGSGGGGLQQTESHLYGSSRLGIAGALTVVPQSIGLSGDYGSAVLRTFTRGEKTYELSNHLGNVLATVSDNKIAVSSSDNSSLIDHYTADITSSQDYYPFGMQMPGRTFTGPGAANYRYGFNGKENDNEVKGIADQIDYGMRVYDPRIGKFLSVDPLREKYPWLSPYQFAENDVIRSIDLDGLEKQIAIDGSVVYGPVNIDVVNASILSNYTKAQQAAMKQAAAERYMQDFRRRYPQQGTHQSSLSHIESTETALFRANLNDPDNIGGQAAYGIAQNLHDARVSFKEGEWGDGTLNLLNAGINTVTLTGAGRVLGVGAKIEVKTNGQVNETQDLAFGLGDNLNEFSAAKGFKNYRQFTSGGFQKEELKAAITDPNNKLHFNLTGWSRTRYLRFNPAQPVTYNNITNWELHLIKTTPGALERTTFYELKNGNYQIIKPPKL